MLNSIESNYNFILIDTSTDMGLISDNALSASDGVIINSKPSHLELMSTIKYTKFLNEKILEWDIILNFNLSYQISQCT